MSRSTNALVMTRGALLSGRQMRSPLPVQIASPSESWISGRQSAACVRLCSPYQNMLENGAMPRRLMSRRAKSSTSMSMTTRWMSRLSVRRSVRMR